MWNEIRTIINELKEFGLNMGHGDGLMKRRKYTIEDIEKLNNLTKTAILLIDKKLGLTSDWGQW